jgi:hypothetical protein
MRKIILLAALLFVQTSCVTKYLWGYKEYKERISQFLVGADGRYVVFVGDQYHYIFTDNSGVLKNILSLSKNVFTIDARETRLKLDSNNNLSGELVMSGLSTSLDPQELYNLRLSGIYPDRNGEMIVRIDASGRRYAAKYLGQTTQSTRSQNITIYYKDSGVIKDAGKIAVTPIAVGVDAVLLIGKVVIKVFEL